MMDCFFPIWPFNLLLFPRNCQRLTTTDLDVWIRQVYICLKREQRQSSTPFSFFGFIYDDDDDDDDDGNSNATSHSREVLYDLLLEDSTYDDFDKSIFDNVEIDYDEMMRKYIEEGWIVHGIPRRPLYKELALRLYCWSHRFHNIQNNNNNDNNNFISSSAAAAKIVGSAKDQFQLIVPAETLGFQESDPVYIPSPPVTYHDIRDWIKNANDKSILRLLGLRQTIGTMIMNINDEGLSRIPHRKKIIQAAQVLHRPDGTSLLTVSARARSKHAHRGERDQFFGIAKGSAQVQNEQTVQILNRIIDEAVWMNLHQFGGIQKHQSVLEVRVMEGYGARWMLEMSENNENGNNSNDDKNQNMDRGAGRNDGGDDIAVTADSKVTIQFRGFLEPQMENGHEKRWRH